MVQKIIRGKIWRFSEDIDTDQIFPGRYLSLSKAEDLIPHCMEGTGHSKFRKEAKAGDLIIAGENFGCGSSREHAPQCIKDFGIGVVIAESFARLFYRNAFNVGLPIVEAPGVSSIEEENEVEVNLESGEIRDLATGNKYKGSPIPPFFFKMLEKGGLIPQLEERFLKKLS